MVILKVPPRLMDEFWNSKLYLHTHIIVQRALTELSVWKHTSHINKTSESIVSLEYFITNTSINTYIKE